MEGMGVFSFNEKFCMILQKAQLAETSQHALFMQVVENQVAVDLVRETKDPKAAAKQLVEYAIQQNSKDDISCVVVRFH